MGSPLSDADESYPRDVFGGVKKTNQALDAFLAQRDPKGRKAAKKNSPAARGARNTLQRTPPEVFLKELLKRAKAERRRKENAEAVARHRARYGRRDRQRGA